MRKITITFLSILISQTSHSALTSLPAAPFAITPQTIFIYAGLGESFSRKGDIKVDLTVWDPAIQGYNHNLGTTLVYTGGIGYQLSCALSADLELSYRPYYSYSKYQEPFPTPNTPGFLGIKTRKFKLKSTALLVNFDLNLGAYGIYYALQNLTISPKVGIGIGASFNTVSSFHSVLASSTIPGFNDVGSVEDPRTHDSIAYQLKLALELHSCQNWALEFGYRYFNGGRFKSNTYVTNVAVGPNSATTTPTWKGHLRANELFAYLKYNFG